MADVELSGLGSVIRPAYEGQLSNLVIVQTKSELPTAVAGVITLATGFLYLINGVINLGTDRIAVNGAIGMKGEVLTHDGLIYTGVGDMFTGDSGGNLTLEDLSITCDNGTVFNIPGDGSGLLFINGLSIVGVGALGLIGQMQLVSIRSSLIATAGAGFTFTGTGGGRFVLEGCSLINNVGDLFDLGTSIYQNISIRENQTIVTPALGNFMTGLVGSGNVGNRATVIGNQFSGAGDAFENITAQDLKWLMDGNQGIGRTEVDGEVYITIPASTSLTIDGTAVLIAGTFTEEAANAFTTTAAGRITYIGLDPIRKKVDAVMNIEPDTGNNLLYEVCLFKNGVAITSSVMQAVISNNAPQSIVVKALVNLVKDDFIEIFLTPMGHTQNATANKLVLLVA